MVELIKSAAAGTLESSDIYVELEPWDGGVELQVESVVEAQFGDAIRDTIRQVLAEQGVESARVYARDRGALDCVIRARVETAVARGRGES